VICILGVPIAGITTIAPHQRGSSSSRMINLCDLPASMTSSRRFSFPMVLEIEQRKWPCRRPSAKIWLRRSDASRNCGPPALDTFVCLVSSRIVQQRFHVLDCSGECERPNAAGFAVEPHYVVAARWTVLEHEHFPAALIAQIEQLVASAPQEAREVEIARFERASTNRAVGPFVDGAVWS